MKAEKDYILVVEDETSINDLIAYHLEKFHYEVQQALSAEEAMKYIEQKTPDMIVLDLMLPKMSGTEFCKVLKRSCETADIGILMLTAKSEKQDIIRGLDAGADDYLTKPFDIEELLARIKSILRRLKQRTSDAVIFSKGPLNIDWARHKIKVNDRSVKLTPTEYKILKTLIENQGRVLTRDRILDLVMGSGTVVIDRTIDVHVLGLRKKLGVKNDFIETIRGVGYRFRDDK
ncbi:MAG: response regulator transcription factor [Deltaproteobacteria bacterium]|nr:response regulator transcription factor [Deltaproteobacteria bacterium]